MTYLVTFFILPNPSCKCGTYYLIFEQSTFLCVVNLFCDACLYFLLSITEWKCLCFILLQCNQAVYWESLLTHSIYFFQLASSDSDESAMMRVDRGTYQHMYQDVVHIKTMLLKLKRVLQEVCDAFINYILTITAILKHWNCILTLCLAFRLKH